MHGRVKVRTTAEQEAIKKKERIEKLAHYRADIGVVFQKRKDKVYDDEMMLVTERMLLQNPDIYTLWNIRREAFVSNSWDNEALQDLYTKELNLTESCLRKNPKSYCVWHQRAWIMERIEEADWKRELMLCAKCLNLDDRNFHCWDYRTFVVQQAEISDAEEFEFSTSKIYNNFSNYSSWHYRSRLLLKMFENFDQETIKKKKKEELDLVLNAAFTDPNDSSAWFYHRWLLHTPFSPTVCDVQFLPPHITVTACEKLFCDLLTVEVNGKKSCVSWEPLIPRLTSTDWTAKINDAEITSMRVGVGATYYDLEHCEDKWVYRGEQNIHSEDLNDQLKNCEELRVMEPDNKWALLTGVVLMRHIDAKQYFEKILESLEKLQKVDSMRRNYYKDLRSRYVIEHKLYQFCCTKQDLQNSFICTEKNLESQAMIDLSSLGLTTLACEQQLATFQQVNLNGNCLSTNLNSVRYLKNCRILSLSNNGLKNLQNFPALSNLKTLVLRNNNLLDVSEILDLLKKVNLCELDLRENPVCHNEELRESVAGICPELKLCMV